MLGQKDGIKPLISVGVSFLNKSVLTLLILGSKNTTINCWHYSMINTD